MTKAPFRRLPLPPILAVFMGLLLTSCVYHREGHGDWCEEQHVCQDVLDCHDGQFCRRGLCRNLPTGSRTCTTSAQCGAREFCIDNVCVQSCARNTDCPNGSRCEEGVCEATSSGGTDGGVPGPRPDAGTPPPSDAGSCGCQPDAGTPPPPVTPPPTCRRNADCGLGYYCINATCHRGCVTDASCASNEFCSMGVCRPRPSNSCANNMDCPEGHDCVDGTCRAYCSSNEECPANTVCRIGYCLDGDTGWGSGQACEENCDCPSGERCVEGTCRL